MWILSLYCDNILINKHRPLRRHLYLSKFLCFFFFCMINEWKYRWIKEKNHKEYISRCSYTVYVYRVHRNYVHDVSYSIYLCTAMIVWFIMCKHLDRGVWGMHFYWQLPTYSEKKHILNNGMLVTAANVILFFVTPTIHRLF